jgi:predicted transcriptional regulator
MPAQRDCTERFLRAFKELENELLSIAQIPSDGHVSFSKALNEVYYSRKNPIISEYEKYDFLKTAADIRNILSHENDACVPTEEYVSKFEKLVDAIIHPLTCYDVCTRKIHSCRKDDLLFDVLSKMDSYMLSHIPVLDEDGVVQGIFSRNTLFDYVCTRKNFQFDENTRLTQFEEFLPLDKHLNEAYLFVSRNCKVNEIYSRLFKNREHEKNVSLLLVTHDGRKSQKLLGVVSTTDLTKYNL